MTALQARTRELEQQLNLERSCRDLERTSRLHPKERSVVFVGTIYLGDNVKYAWLAFRERARAQGIACWFLPQDEAQELAVRALGDACFPRATPTGPPSTCTPRWPPPWWSRATTC